MKRILADHWQRWRWAMLIPGPIAFLSTALPPKVEMASGIFPALGAFFLSLDLARGIARVQRHCPVSKHEIAMAWWLFGAVIPAGICVGGAGAGWVARLLLVHPETPVMTAALGWLLQSAFAVNWAAVLFICLTQLTMGEAGGVAGKLRQGLAGAAWGANIGFSIFYFLGLSQLLARAPGLHPAGAALLALAGPLLVLSYLAAGGAVRRRSEQKLAGSAAGIAGSNGFSFGRFGEGSLGLKQWLVREAWIQSLFAWGFAAAAAAGMFLMPVLSGGAVPKASIPMGMLILVPLMRSGSVSIRQWRTLPMSAGALAACLVKFPAMLLFVNCVVIQFVFSWVGSGQTWKAILLQSSLMAVVAAFAGAVALRFKFLAVALVAAGFSGPMMMLGLLLRWGQISWWWSLYSVLVAMGGVVVAQFMAARWIRRSDAPYSRDRVRIWPMPSASMR